MTRFVKFVAVCTASVLGLTGCISLLPETEPTTLYRLDLEELSDANPARDTQSVVIERIVAPRGLAGDRIAIERNGSIAYMSGAAWLAPAPTLLYTGVIDSFHANAPAIAPARTEDGVNARYELDLQLRHFEAVYDQGETAAPLIRVSIRARLIDRVTRSVVDARTLDASSRATANRQRAIVDSFSAASAEMGRSLAQWTQGLVCQDEDAPAACG